MPDGGARQGARDVTAGSIGSALFGLAVPAFVSNVIQTFMVTANVAWVSHYLGDGALAPVVNANQLFFMVWALVLGLTLAASILIARAAGAGDGGRIAAITGASLLVLLAGALAIAAFGLVAGPAILRLLRVPAEAFGPAQAYLRLLFLTLPAMMLFNFLSLALRSLGDAHAPMLFAILLMVLDFALCPLMLGGFGRTAGLGVAGAAAASFLAQHITLAAMIAWIARCRPVLGLDGSLPARLRPDRRLVGALAAIGLPMSFQTFVTALSLVAMLAIVNRLPAATVAAYGASVQIWNYLQMPGFAFSSAVTVIAAQCLGAGHPARAGAVARCGALLAGAVTLGAAIGCLAVSDRLLGLFLDGANIAVAQRINATAIWSFVPLSAATALFGWYYACGRTLMPALAVLVALVLARVWLAEVLLARWGEAGLWHAFWISATLLLALLSGLYAAQAQRSAAAATA